MQLINFNTLFIIYVYLLYLYYIWLLKHTRMTARSRSPRHSTRHWSSAVWPAVTRWGCSIRGEGGGGRAASSGGEPGDKLPEGLSASSRFGSVTTAEAASAPLPC